MYAVGSKFLWEEGLVPGAKIKRPGVMFLGNNKVIAYTISNI
jgi:hypothetical protein